MKNNPTFIPSGKHTMIGRLKGTIIRRQPPELLLDINGVGYEVSAPMTTFYRLPTDTSEVILHTHLVVREDVQQLYGFFDLDERELFRLLIKVNGVGPKMALAILSGIEFTEFVRSVNENNVTSLVKIPGVGKKTAERLVIEMRDKLKKFAAGPLFNNSENAGSQGSNSIIEDAESALVALGYKAALASKVVQQVYEAGLSSDEIIRKALRGMA